MYYYHDGENEVGPFGAEKLNRLASAGLVGGGTLIRAADSNSWVPYDQLELSGDSRQPPAAQAAINPSAEITASQTPDVAESIEVDKWTVPLESPVDTDVIRQSTNDVVSSSGWLAKPYTPWRRYAARMLDTTLNGTVVFFLFGIAFYSIAPAAAEDFFSIFETPNGSFLNIMATAIAASFLGGLLVGVSGFTLGKWIFGIKVTRLDGTKLGVGAGLSRDFSVALNGLGLGIPLVSLFTMWSAYKKLSENKPASWDEGKYIVWHRPKGASQYILNVVGILLILLVLVVVSALGAL